MVVFEPPATGRACRTVYLGCLLILRQGHAFLCESLRGLIRRSEGEHMPSAVAIQTRPDKRLAREFARPDMGRSCREGGNAVWQHPMTWLLSPPRARYKWPSQVIIAHPRRLS